MFVALFDLLVLPTWQGPLRSTFIDALRMGFSFGSVRFGSVLGIAIVLGSSPFIDFILFALVQLVEQPHTCICT